MYDWHTTHPEKGDRFRRAMRGVSKCKLLSAQPFSCAFVDVIALDPADSLLRKHIPENGPSSGRTKIVEIGGRYGFASTSLVAERAKLCFEVRCDSQDFLQRGEALVPPSSKERINFTKLTSSLEVFSTSDSTNVLAYVVRNVFWNWTDDDAVKLLQALLPTLRDVSSSRILVTDGVSPAPKQFPPHVEIAYRRRDITTMTMHNVKQRTQAEWLKMFARVHPSLKVSLNTQHLDQADISIGQDVL
tara:strand:- start:9711 stop:10445 length:735 start_codon:yes stop_codon:yes gene_type:complete